jgi:hypothetical protein
MIYLAFDSLSTDMADDEKTKELSGRINELGNKSGQVLLFLSFVMVSAATLEAVKGEQLAALNDAMWWWKLALFPVLAGILPMKEFCWNSPAWYRIIRWLRVGLIWLAVILTSTGAYRFISA